MKSKKKMNDYKELEEHVIFWAYTKLKHIRDYESAFTGMDWFPDYMRTVELGADALLVSSILSLLEPFECEDPALIRWARGFVSAHDFLLLNKNSVHQLNLDIRMQ